MYEKEIRQMKEAAEQQNWESFQQLLRVLICEISYKALFKLLLSYTQIFMNDFMIINPQYKFDVTNLQTPELAQIFEVQLRIIIDILEKHKGEPGVNNFRTAISKLQSLFQLNNGDGIFIETFVNSTTNILIAISHQSWGRTHPQLYNQWLHGTSNEDLSILATHYARNPEQSQKSKLLMLQFAYDISVLIQPDKQ